MPKPRRGLPDEPPPPVGPAGERHVHKIRGRVAVVAPYLSPERGSPPSQAEGADAEAVNLPKEPRFEVAERCVDVFVAQLPEELFLCEPRHLVLCPSHPNAEGIGRAPPSLSLLDRVEDAPPDAVQVPLRL